MGLRNLIYNGKLFTEFCLENDIPFNEFESRFKRMRNNKKLDKYSDEYLIDYIVRNFYSDKKKSSLSNRRKYYVDNVPLVDFAKQNGVLSLSMRSAIYSGLRKNPDADTSELAKSFVARSKEKYNYTYDGYLLTKICKMYNLSYTKILKVFYEEYPERDNMTDEEKDSAIKDIVDMFIKEKNKKEKVKGLRYEI